MELLLSRVAIQLSLLTITLSCPDPVCPTGLSGPAGPRHLERKHCVPVCTPGFLVFILMTIFWSPKESQGWEQSSGNKSCWSQKDIGMRMVTDTYCQSFQKTRNCHPNKFQRTWLRFHGCSPFKCSKIMTAYTPVLGFLNVNLSHKREAQITVFDEHWIVS